MKFFKLLLLFVLMYSCSKVIEIELPAYEAEAVVEMYLQDGAQLQCLLSESLPYTSDSINRQLDSALVIFSDGVTNDTLKQTQVYDFETGRRYNYSHPRIVFADESKTFTLKIVDTAGREMYGTTQFSQKVSRIDSVVYRPSVNSTDSFSVGFVITDPPSEENYYRFTIAKSLTDYTDDPVDMTVADMAFEGKTFSFYSESEYVRNDTVTVRVYSLLKEHYDYLQSTYNARTANFNPFIQPAAIKSNIKGGIGIFAAIRYDERKIVIR